MTSAIAERTTPNLPAPTRIGQGTAVEQSRAVAEVEAAIVVAQRVPRDPGRALRDMQRSCAQKSLAEKAFFRYKRAGAQISGPSVQLARELARCWGNVQYGVTELRRDDDYGQSEMQAWSWDVQTNTRSSTTFIVLHRRDTKTGSYALTEQRDIYENNANMGARRLREMIFAILPGWYTEDAVAACYATLADEGGEDGTLAERVEKAVAGFGKMGVTEAQLVRKMGAPAGKWTPQDLAQLTVIYRSIQRAETRAEDEFEVTAADIPRRSDSQAAEPAAERSKPARKPRQRQQAAEEVPLPPDPAGGAERPRARASSGQVGIIHTHFTRLGYEDHEREERLVFTAVLAGHGPDLESSSKLTEDQARRAIGRLQGIKDRPELIAAVSRIEQDDQAEASHG